MNQHFSINNASLLNRPADSVRTSLIEFRVLYATHLCDSFVHCLKSRCASLRRKFATADAKRGRQRYSTTRVFHLLIEIEDDASRGLFLFFWLFLLFIFSFSYFFFYLLIFCPFVFLSFCLFFSKKKKKGKKKDALHNWVTLAALYSELLYRHSCPLSNDSARHGMALDLPLRTVYLMRYSVPDSGILKTVLYSYEVNTLWKPMISPIVE